MYLFVAEHLAALLKHFSGLTISNAYEINSTSWWTGLNIPNNGDTRQKSDCFNRDIGIISKTWHKKTGQDQK